MSVGLRVLVVPKWYPWPDQPVHGIFCREHARALSRRHEVVVLASRATRSPEFALFRLEDAVEEGLRTLRVHYRRPRMRPLAMACQLAGMLVALWRLRREGWRPDVVHAHVYSAGVPALVLGRLSRAKVVVTEHYTGFQRGLIGGYDRLVARVAFARADLVAPVSRELEQHLRALAPRARLRTMPNVVDTDVFEPHPRADRSGPPLLLNVAALAEKKGQAHLLEALTEVDGAELDVVGAGPLLPQLREQAERLGVAGRVRFRGEVPKEEVARLMRAADLFVLPSLHENQPCVLIEAMASGLPAVATRVGGVPELLDETEAAHVGGTLVSPGEPAELADAIKAALAKRPDPAALAREARERFGYAAFARAWTCAYEEIGASRRGSTSSATRRRRASSE